MNCSDDGSDESEGDSDSGPKNKKMKTKHMKKSSRDKQGRQQKKKEKHWEEDNIKQNGKIKQNKSNVPMEIMYNIVCYQVHQDEKNIIRIAPKNPV